MKHKSPASLQLRSVVTEFHSALLARLIASKSANKEAIRLMEIGLKWEQFDADPGVLIRLIGSQGIPNPSLDQRSTSVMVSAIPTKNTTMEPKATAQPTPESSIMDDWMIDPVSMFEEDVPMSKHMLVPA